MLWLWRVAPSRRCSFESNDRRKNLINWVFRSQLPSLGRRGRLGGELFAIYHQEIMCKKRGFFNGIKWLRLNSGRTNLFQTRIPSLQFPPQVAAHSTPTLPSSVPSYPHCVQTHTLTTKTPSFLLLLAQRSRTRPECIKHVVGRDIDGIQRDHNPQAVEEDEEDPLVHPVAGVEIEAACQPLGHESHVSCSASVITLYPNRSELTAVKLGRCQDDHDQVRPRTLARNVVAGKAGHGPGKEHRDDLDAQDSLPISLSAISLSRT